MKIPYEPLPSMERIAGFPRDRATLVSTFSGCGGSCLGFRMAGCRTLWANEFVEAAAIVYKMNAPDVHVDQRDIREVRAEDILDITGLAKGELDIFEGSPPCASFSTAGARSKKWGQVSKYSDTEQRTDDLFFEYARILRGLQPKVFVAENVQGLVIGSAKGYFKMILKELKGCGYKVSARVLDGAWLGVPQRRKRVIFVGVRNDLEIEPAFPKPLPFQWSVRDALPWIQKVVHDTSGQFSEGEFTDRPSPTILIGPNALNSRHYVVESEEEGVDISAYAIGREWDKIQMGEQSDRYLNLVKPALDKPCPTVTQTAGQAGAAGVVHPTERRKFSMPELRRIMGFPDDFKLTGSYQQRWERFARSVPPMMMYWIASAVLRGVLDREPAWDWHAERGVER